MKIAQTINKLKHQLAKVQANRSVDFENYKHYTQENRQLKRAIEFLKDIIARYQDYQDYIEDAILVTSRKADLIKLQQYIIKDRRER